MKRDITILLSLFLLIAASPVAAMQGHGGSHDKEMKNQATGGHEDAHSKGDADGVFTHEGVAEEIRAEFQVMSLESMNMKDPDGYTHHIMVKLFPEGSDQQIKNAVGKVKIISPSKKEFTATLKDYSGIFAANFTADEPGKYGVICLIKVNDKKPLYKFWYHHTGKGLKDNL